MMASENSPDISPSTADKVYKRASRKGAPRRFPCPHPGCDKLYSRAEHLQRHQLNHNPKEIFACDTEGCHQKFVRLDLLSRHKKRHTPSYAPRNRVPSFNKGHDGFNEVQDELMTVTPTFTDAALPEPVSSNYRPLPVQPPQPSSGPHHAAIRLTPVPDLVQTPVPMGISHPHPPWPAFPTYKHLDFYGTGAPPPPPAPASIAQFPPASLSSAEGLIPDNFAAWLFGAHSANTDFSVASLPFHEGGLESAFNNEIRYDYESISHSSVGMTPPSYLDIAADDYISDGRRLEVVRMFLIFCKKQPQYESLMPRMLQANNGELVALNVDMIRECLVEFWETVSPRLPIVHQHTFSPNRCHIFLLMVMLALGATSLCNRDSTGHLAEYGPFGEVIVSTLRWEILTSDNATPPVSLWVAQALLLVEFYEKLYSTRKFHERAHIYHPAFLTLLRRGSPLIGQAGNESPQEADHTHHQGGTQERTGPGTHSDSRMWWTRWADSESMHRVVFAAFMLDVIHAAMFGHTADMTVHEIRLPLPCNDGLWMAGSPELVRQLEAKSPPYGVKQISFLEGLKSALHGKEVKTHAFGRMIIMSGLLSVAWHLGHKQNHLKWLDIRGPSLELQDSWRKMLLGAFDQWKISFDQATAEISSYGNNQGQAQNGPICSASVLYHLSHLSLHSDFVDCQVYAGAKRVLGRKISTRDYHNVVRRMNTWAKEASTRHAILHAFKLLHHILVGVNTRYSGQTSFSGPSRVGYFIRGDQDPHRPWIMYYACLTVWAFVNALGQPSGEGAPPRKYNGADVYTQVADYLTSVARLQYLDAGQAAMLHDGLPQLLDVVEGILVEAQTELLVEARERLKICKEMLLAGSAKE